MKGSGIETIGKLQAMNYDKKKRITELEQQLEDARKDRAKWERGYHELEQEVGRLRSALEKGINALCLKPGCKEWLDFTVW